MNANVLQILIVLINPSIINCVVPVRSINTIIYNHPTCACLSSSSLCSLSNRLPSSSCPLLLSSTCSSLEEALLAETPVLSSLSLPSAMLISWALARSVSSCTWSSWMRLWRLRLSCSACCESWEEACRSWSKAEVSWATRVLCASRVSWRSWIGKWKHNLLK